MPAWRNDNRRQGIGCFHIADICKSDATARTDFLKASNENLTSADVKSLPSCHFTPLRSLNVCANHPRLRPAFRQYRLRLEFLVELDETFEDLGGNITRLRVAIGQGHQRRRLPDRHEGRDATLLWRFGRRNHTVAKCPLRQEPHPAKGPCDVSFHGVTSSFVLALMFGDENSGGLQPCFHETGEQRCTTGRMASSTTKRGLWAGTVPLCPSAEEGTRRMLQHVGEVFTAHEA